jgi:hypothetical protein
MRKPYFVLWLTGGLLMAACQLSQAQAPSQYPIVDKIADKVVQKYQNTSCDELKAKKQQPPSAQKQSPMEQKAIEELKSNPDMRQHFLDKIAGPIANKMFECGMTP